MKNYIFEFFHGSKKYISILADNKEEAEKILLDSLGENLAYIFVGEKDKIMRKLKDKI